MRGWAILVSGWAFTILFLVGCPPSNKHLHCKSCETEVPEPEKVTVHWERLHDPHKGVGYVHRTKVPAGWIVHDQRNSPAMVYVPDPKHEWLAEKPEVSSE